MLGRPRIAWICSRCLSKRRFASSAQELPPLPPASGATKLTSRRLLALHGQDVSHYLQGLTTQNIRFGQSTGFYSAFLTATGRVLNDVFIYPANQSDEYMSTIPENISRDDPAYIIEVDAKEALALLKHLKRYKLRAKVNIRALEEEKWNAWSVWNEEEPWTPHPPPASSAPSTSGTDVTTSIGCVDLRAPGMGRRIVLPSSDTQDPTLEAAGVHETTLEAYTLRRMLKGVAEGQDEIKREHALPQESNIDFMAGIDFRKGCYVGQELTIRTHHTGIVRKRILPAMLYDMGSTQPEKLVYEPTSDIFVGPPDGTNIIPASKKGRSAGRWIGGIGNIGLALCRVEMMTDMVLTGEGSRWNPDDEFKLNWGGVEGHGQELKIKAFVPDWVRSKTKVKNPNQQVA